VYFTIKANAINLPRVSFSARKTPFPFAFCLAVTTADKKIVRFLTDRCYCELNVFSKLNKDNEYHS
ncbi:hypothetical protein, partial [Klebsiella pneumoniae]|uniref:hypothetical protein n=1 Tax=Klebsiella pneumoniae TaxID=573 RepID=UPI001D0D96B8